MSRRKAVSLLLITGIIWSTGGFIIKLIPWSSMVIAGLRSGITAVVIFFYVRPKNFSFSFNTWAGAFCYALMVICFVIGNKLTTAGNVILIQYAAPIYVAIFSFSFLGERASKFDWLAIIIIMIGLIFFFLDELSLTQLWGNVFSILSGFGFAGLTLLMRKQKNERPIDSVLIGNILTFSICSPFYFGGLTTDINAWAMIIFLGVIQLGLSYILFGIVIRHVSALDAIIYPVIEPICNPIFAFLFLDESMSTTSQVGGGLVIVGILGRGLIKEMSFGKGKPLQRGFP